MCGRRWDLRDPFAGWLGRVWTASFPAESAGGGSEVGGVTGLPGRRVAEGYVGCSRCAVALRGRSAYCRSGRGARSDLRGPFVRGVGAYGGRSAAGLARFVSRVVRERSHRLVVMCGGLGG